MSNKMIDIKDKQFNEWKVLYHVKGQYWRCQCSCGKIQDKTSYALRYGKSKSCGHSKLIELKDKTFGELRVNKYIGDGMWECTCSCGNIINVNGQHLRNGGITRCKDCRYQSQKDNMIDKYGDFSTHKIDSPREKWQVNILSNKKEFMEWLQSFGYKPFIYEIANKLNTSKSSILKALHKYELEDYTSLGKELIHSSNIEEDVYKYICSLGDFKIIRNDRNLINPKELDFYIPEKKLAIEFNGNYWHSDVFKDKYYHQNKTIACAKQGIRLIHIFEYEWLSNKQDKIKVLLKEILCGTSVIYGRNTYIKEIGNKDAIDFEEKNHLQSSVNTSVNIALYNKNDIVALFTFGVPRYDRTYQYELIRVCYKQGISVIGGSEKIFNYFIKKYKPESIITYCDISKFIGIMYTKLGFTPIQPNPITEPNYVWLNTDNNSILPRYKTQKHKLIEHGLGIKSQTESEIMESLGYIKIYDSGNLRLEWNKKY